MKAYMKASVVLLLAATTLSAQDTENRPKAEPMLATIKSVDSTRTPSISISVRGRLLKYLGVAKGQAGILQLQGNSGTATGVLVAELSADAGEMSFTSPLGGPALELDVWPSSGAGTPRLQVRGHIVRVVRARSGHLSVTAVF
jgi:hypothetical protein